MDFNEGRRKLGTSPVGATVANREKQEHPADEKRTKHHQPFRRS
jgi:hypothetical protein